MREQDPEISHFFGGGVYLKETQIPAGMVLVQHVHEYDHLAYVVRGTVLVTVDDTQAELTGPACLTIKAGKHHGVKALTPVTWLCIHATECTDAEQVDKVLIADGSDSETMQAMAERLAHV